MRSSLLIAIIVCLIIGALGGGVSARMVDASTVNGVLTGAAFGLVFAVLAEARAIEFFQGHTNAILEILEIGSDAVVKRSRRHAACPGG